MQDNNTGSPRRNDGGSRRGRGHGHEGARRRDNSSFGERQGRSYRDGSPRRDADRRGGDPRGTGGERGDRGIRDGGPRGGGRRFEGHDGQRRGQRGNGPRRENRRGGRPDRAHRDGYRHRTADDAAEGPKNNDPAIPDDIEPQDLDAEIRRDLRSLNKANADLVARHLVAAMWAIDDNPQLALRHARAAKARAGRIGVVREMLGVIAYNAGEWSETLAELRAARRMQGGPGLLALMADAERGMKRPERAIELARSDEATQLSPDDLVELKIVEAGARMDLDQVDAAIVTLQDAGLSADGEGEQAARLAYAYADILAASGRAGEAKVWFESAIAADPDSTDAEDRLAKLEQQHVDGQSSDTVTNGAAAESSGEKDE